MNNLSLETLKQLVTNAYKLCREGRLLELSTSQLAHTSLVEDCFLSNVPVSPDVRGGTLQSILHWATDRLRPSGKHSWVAYQWRLYNTIYYFYFEHVRIAELAERMAIAEQTLYQIRGEAMATIARVLQAELQTPSNLAGRKHYVIANRYARLSADQQLILRLLAAFQQGMPSKLLHQLAAQNNATHIQQAIHQLVASNWIVTNERGTELLLQPEVSHDLLTRLTPTERSTWHQAIGDYFVARRRYFEAAQHYFSADLPQTAAQICIDHYQAIVADLRVDDLLKLIGEIHPSDLEESIWVRLKVIAGDAAYLLEDVDTALREYQQALSATDLSIKALAYYRRAKVLEVRSSDEALASYAYCIQLLERLKPIDPLIVQVYINRAFFCIEQERHITRSENDLQRAAQLIEPTARADWSHLHNAWLMLSILKGEWEKAIEHGQQAWLAANEIHNVDRMLHTSHNIGQLYARLGRFEQALPYLEQSLKLAREVGNRHREGLSLKSIGNGKFMLEAYVEAEQLYQAAYAIFIEVGNDNWKAHTCYDLAEVYAELGDQVAMQRYFEEGSQIAHAAGDVRLIEEFESFGRNHQSLFTKLNPRQQAALDHIKANGKITNKQYQRINDVSARQALRDLQELEESGILIKLGRGRATHYRLINT